jgi:hypothetical protein
MELSNWPQIAPINQKNYYTYVRLARGSPCKQGISSFYH